MGAGMAESLAGTLREDLGVGAVFSHTFSVFLSRFPQIVLLAMIPAIAIALVNAILISPLLISPDTRSLAVALNWIAGMAGSAIIVALIVRYTFDARSGRRMRIGSYLSSTMAVLFPLIVCSLISSVVATLAVLLSAAPGFILRDSTLMITLAVPGILFAVFIASVWAAVTPSIVIENAGFASFARSTALTRGYRGPCFAAVFLFVLLGLGFTLALFFGLKALFGADLGIATANFFHNAMRLSSSAILAGFTGVFSATLYARLREIKESTTNEDLAEVFV
jgi:hypothetical protein